MAISLTAAAEAKWINVLSPELALVDPGLAERARAALDADAVAAAPPPPEKPPSRLPVDDAARRACERLLEAAVAAEVVPPAPARSRIRRWAGLAGTGSAAAVSAVLLLQALAAPTLG